MDVNGNCGENDNVPQQVLQKRRLTSGRGDERSVQSDVVGKRPDLVELHLRGVELLALLGRHKRIVTDYLEASCLKSHVLLIQLSLMRMALMKLSLAKI